MVGCGLYIAQRNKVPPLTEALRLGHDETVALLLQDERVDVAQLTADVRRNGCRGLERGASWDVVP